MAEFRVCVDGFVIVLVLLGVDGLDLVGVEGTDLAGVEGSDLAGVEGLDLVGVGSLPTGGRLLVGVDDWCSWCCRIHHPDLRMMYAFM